MGCCSVCGAELIGAAKFCSSCGAAQAEVLRDVAVEPADPGVESAGVFINGPGSQAGGESTAAASTAANRDFSRKIENHLVKSIIATLCCCTPLGIVGIVYAAKVDSALRRNDFAAALEASEKADIWSNLAICLGIAWSIIVGVVSAIMSVRNGDIVNVINGLVGRLV